MREIRSVLPSGRGLRVAVVGSAFAVATLGLSITPAQADGPSGGQSVMPRPGVGVVPGPDPLDDPAKLADFLSRCGDNCTVENAERTGDAVEGTPERVGKPVSNCTDSDISPGWSESETKTEGIVIGMSVGIAGSGSLKPVTATPSIQYTSTTATMVGQDVRQTTQKPYTIAWLDKVPATWKLKGTWKLEGVDQTNPFAPVNEFNAKGPRTFDNVEANVTYETLKVHTRPMDANEKAQCSNASPS